MYSANLALRTIPTPGNVFPNYPQDMEGGYAPIAKAALAEEITHTKLPQGFQAYGYVASQIAYFFAQSQAAGYSETEAQAYQSEPEWSEMPKLPDGVYLENSRMQIDASGAGTVLLTATGSDSLLAVVGNGTATLKGGSGGRDLLYGGTTTLDAGTGYLFGGPGPTTFVDNIGNDYMHGAPRRTSLGSARTTPGTTRSPISTRPPTR